MAPPKVWIMLVDYEWEEVELTEAQHIAGLKAEIKRALTPKIIREKYDKLTQRLIDGEISDVQYQTFLDLSRASVNISLVAVNFKAVLKENECYNREKHLDPLKEAATLLSPQLSLLDVLRGFKVDGTDQIDANNMDTVRKLFCENIWVFVYLPNAPTQARDHPAPEQEFERTWKKPRLDEDMSPFLTWFFSNWLFTPQCKRPKLLPPVPKTQDIITEGNFGIYAGRDVPIGTDNFEAIVTEDCSFVDKTLLISEFLQCTTRVSLVVRPRRFGKTTNLTMLKNFFACPIEPDNKERRQELFRDSKIWREERKLFDEHFCKYPVISFSLKAEHPCETWEKMEKDIRLMIAGLYEEHKYVYSALSNARKLRFNDVLNADPKLDSWGRTLKELSEYLKAYYNRRCIVLIDEYDYPLDVAFHHGFYETARDFFKSLLGSLLKSNDLNIYRAFLVGVMRVAKAGYLSDFNNVMVYGMFNTRFSDKFGFTEEEVAILLRHHQKTDMEGVKKWYDGYGATNNISLYNPWSVISYIQLGVLDTHWVDTATTETIQRLIWHSRTTFKESAAELIEGETIERKLLNNLSYNDLSRNSDDALWTLLYYSGYLSHKNDLSNTGASTSDAQHSTPCDAVPMKLCIPNAEVANEWRRWLQISNAPPLSSVVDALLNGHLKKFHQFLSDTVIEALSFNDVGGSKAGKKSESFYHGFSLGWLIDARFRGCTIKSNREAGLGRSDGHIEHQERRQAAIMEFKIDRGNGTMKKKAEEALSQIERKEYRREVSSGIEQLVEVGIAFKGKFVMITGKVYKKEDGKWLEKDGYEGEIDGLEEDEDGDENMDMDDQ